MRTQNGKDFAQLRLTVLFLLIINQKEGPTSQTYRENMIELIRHEREPVSCLEPTTPS